ncbi:MucR family transcriptional regulator [Sphingomonas sp.]|jgi:predicted transcriptional regulator|uniref:MucR family transcriptional regulator n=1 Tax=Sphingomonas sp. TaxID=28214 RepID=UPI002D80A761|nr:MucR family transcriptional regulator [Sphingomonas sp.]HEU0043115.1 MucR family transcriptional regulator [Sphingomonas sp.]
MADDTTDLNAVELAVELTIAWLGNPNTRSNADDVPAFMGRMHDTVQQLMGSNTTDAAAEPVQDYQGKVTARKSLASKDHIISMIDGKPYKTLRRHLATNGLTPDQYRERYGLKPDYPMVAENYSESRRAMAKQIGLGRKPGQKKGEPAPAAAATPASGGRGRKKATAPEAGAE